jgi:hypothetical protein
MKSIKKLLISVYTLICYNSFAQNPSFSSNLNISNSFVCFGGQLTVSARASNADFYQFQKRNETTNLWENIIGASGTPNLANGSLSHTFFGINETITTRVFISKNTEIVYSNDLTITPQRPIFNFQPIDITECNGLNAVFRVSASGVNTTTYQWQEYIGGVYQNTTNTTDFSGMTTANLTVKNLANNENGRIFRCLVKDQNNCENYSSSATLYVNQLSSVISPTLSKTFCEGDTAQFFVALRIGAVSSFEWQLKKTLDAGYSKLTESNHFEGVNTEKLIVNGIIPTETSYRLNVNFVSLGQNADGSRGTNTCLKTATRANYIIRPRPNSPAQIDDIYRCGEGKLTTTATGTGSFYWYSDTTKAPFISNSPNFVSPIISESKPYFYSLKNINQCESYKRAFMAVVRPLPTQEYTKTYSYCPSEHFFTINFNAKNNNPLQLNVINHSPALPNFTPILNGTFSESFNVPLPNNPSSGNYKFKVFTKNEHCYSDTNIIDLEIKQATSINVSPSNSTICEGLNNTFNFQYAAEAPVYFRWFKDDIVIPNETTSTLTLNNITRQNQGNYSVEVSGQCGIKTSEKALLTVLPKISISEQPKETIVCENGNTKIKLVATGTGVLSYEWTLNGALIGTNSSELILANVPISYNNAKIKCKINSDCGIAAYSNEILLLVDDLPSAPTIPSTIGYCKSNKPGVLSAVPTPKHSLLWFDESQNPFVSNLIDIGSIYTKTYYVSQKDSNLCEGPKSSFQVNVSEPFSIKLIADKAGVCSSGIFNRTGFINTVVYATNSDLSSFFFDLHKNSLPISSNSTGEFEISAGGLYKVIGRSNYCSDTSEIEILSILPELNVPPSVLPTFEVCKNSTLTIEATGSYSGGNFHWYSNATTQFINFSGGSRTLTHLISAQSQYVAYGITLNDIYCESPRVLSTITLKPDLIIEAVTQNTSCLGINDGKIKSSINNGQSPYSFTINNINNTTGIFENLSIGSYQITASDAMGCKGEKTISIGAVPGPNITQQPVSISRCKSNIANFTIIANNYDQIIWEKKLPNTSTFEVIIGENQSNLRIENIGNTTHPHLSVFRAKIIKGACFIYSAEATLYVNAIAGTGLPKSVCEAGTANIDLNDYNIVGPNKIYQWQFRLGTTGTFVDLNGKTNENLEILNASISNVGYYRCKITFDNGGGNTCIINTSTSGIKLTVDVPQIPILTGEKTICKGQTTSLTATNCTGILTWSDGSTGLNVNILPSTTTTYTAICKIGTCNSPSENSVKIIVEEGPINTPNIVLSRTKYCVGEKINITAENCIGIVVWSNGLQGNSIEINAVSSFNISAFCKTEICQSPESPTMSITVYPFLTAGSIVSNSIKNCSGFNPLTINSISNPNRGNIQWQKSENCSSQNPSWENIDGETGLTYNPPALLTSTCFRRMVSDSCQTLFSNVTTFEILPDPILEILADQNQVCFGQKVLFSKNLVGGEGICGIQWQINKVSSAVSSAFWTNITVADILEFDNNNTGNDSTFHFRAKVDCSNNSCNLATSNVVSVTFYPELVINTTFSDSTICSGDPLTLSSSGCKANMLWSTGETQFQISVSPIVNTTFSVSCKNTCDEISKSINIVVDEGIEKPINTTPESFLSPQILKFTADGQNLKWYNSVNSLVPLTEGPETTIPGNYTYWVTQTIGICESPRLEIQSKLFPALQITLQPSNIINCFGNTSNIAINASGSGTLRYKWQRKRPNENSFSDITSNQSSLENFDSKELKIKSIGNLESPYLSKFRCIINDDFSEKQSEEIEIIVNRLEGNLPNQKLCLGNNLDLNLNNSHKITGSPMFIQWQRRQDTGNEWVNLKDSANYSGTNTLHFSINNLTLENQKQYRCSVLFNSTSGSCSETTDLMSLSVGSFPQTPENKGFEFCQNVSSPKLELYEPNNLDITWYLPGSQIGMTKQPIVNTKIAGNQIYYYSFTNSGDCESSKAIVQIIINPEPPKPLNITPNQVIEGQSLIFNAVGENLKWYTSRTGKSYTSNQPTYQKIGSYDHYVSQTSLKGCESDRTFIESEIIAAFGITTQPVSQSNCEDNSTTFSIKTKGSSSVRYRWQILKNGIFEDILGENTSSLKIEDVGKAPHLDGTIYRCLVSNSSQEIVSNEVSLKVNKIEGKLADMEICENNLIITSVFKENIVGNFSQIEWQKKEGDSYNTIFISKKVDDNFRATSDISGTYRLRVTFQNQGSNTCVRTSNALKMVVNNKPEPLQKLNFSVCQYTSMKSILKEFPSNYVFRNLDSSLVDNNYFYETTPLVFIGNYTNEKGCVSDYQKINFDILPAPKLLIGDSTINYCQFSNELKTLKINNLNTFWYFSETEDEATENAFQINTSGNQTHFRWYALEGNNGCLSRKNKLRINLNPCFYTEKKDTCHNQSGKTLLPNEWNYFYDINGYIYAAIHPNGQNLGTARIDFRNTKDTILIDINETQLYPRYFNVQTSRKSTSEFKLRFYMTLQEITAITGKDPEDVSVINYAGKNLDCDLLNNNIDNNYWLETNEMWLKENQQNIFFVEFSTQKTGEFGLWDTSIPKGFLSGEVNNINIPELKLSDKSTEGNYIIMKSKDAKSWFEWLPNVTQSEFVDLKPFVLVNYYQLLFDYGNGIKTVRNTVKLTLADEDVTCAILENPSENRDFIKFYFPNLDKTTIRLSTVLGQSLDLEKTSEVSDYLEIYPKTQLSAGLYILSAQNSSGKNCILKVWLK